MRKRKTLILCLLAILFSVCEMRAQNIITSDVLVIGGGASGVSAGIQAARMGAETIIVEETSWVGGMLTSAGVSAIDGNSDLPAGMWGEFRDKLIEHYGSAEALQTGWVSNVQFEPSVGNKIFRDLIAREESLQLLLSTELLSVKQKSNGNWAVKVRNADKGTFVINAIVLIDATELGDVAKAVGVKYDIGMESRYITREDIAPESGNGIIQDLTYVAVLKDYGTDVTIPRPEGYDASKYACSAINDQCITPTEPDRMWSPDKLITYGKLPGNKYMINWPIEGNDYYLNIIEASPMERKAALQEAKNFTMGFLYFIQTSLGYNTLGLADDEFPTEDRLPFIPYHRESRRIHGLVRFNLNHITDPYGCEDALYRTCVAVGDYPVDHHHARYTGDEELPRLYFHPVPSFGLPLGTLIPQGVDNFIVAEKSISVSNIVNGTTRLQPVVLQIGTAAGTLAALSVSEDVTPGKVSVRQVQHTILDAGGYLLPYLDVKKEDPRFGAYQRIGATGILKGEGRNVGWANQTWLRADTLLLSTEISGLKDVYPQMTYRFASQSHPMTIAEVVEVMKNIVETHNLKTATPVKEAVENILCDDKSMKIDFTKYITRGEFAVVIDSVLNPFDYKDVSMKGKFIK